MKRFATAMAMALLLAACGDDAGTDADDAAPQTRRPRRPMTAKTLMTVPPTSRPGATAPMTVPPTSRPGATARTLPQHRNPAAR